MIFVHFCPFIQCIAMKFPIFEINENEIYWISLCMCWYPWIPLRGNNRIIRKFRCLIMGTLANWKTKRWLNPTNWIFEASEFLKCMSDFFCVCLNSKYNNIFGVQFNTVWCNLEFNAHWPMVPLNFAICTWLSEINENVSEAFYRMERHIMSNSVKVYVKDTNGNGNSLESAPVKFNFNLQSLMQ